MYDVLEQRYQRQMAELERQQVQQKLAAQVVDCLLYTSPSPRDVEESRMPSSA